MRTSHTFTVLSVPPAATHVPLGWKSTQETKLERQEPPRGRGARAGWEQTPERRAPSLSPGPLPPASLPPGALSRWPGERERRARAAAAVTPVDVPGDKAKHRL